jgi:hypothetical protein
MPAGAEKLRRQVSAPFFEGATANQRSLFPFPHNDDISTVGTGLEKSSENERIADLAMKAEIYRTGHSRQQPIGSCASSCIIGDRTRNCRYPNMNNLNVLSLRISAAACFAVASINFQAATAHAATTDVCAPIEPFSAPRATISNGIVNAVVLLPDAINGYYRGARFDWSGVIGCLTYRGHNYFGVWFPKYDPTRHDSITGPVEEFRAADGESAPGYDKASPGGIFVKPGVGALRRMSEAPFSFAAPYPLIDGGKWTVHVGKRQVTFRQVLNTQIGTSYVYKKKLKLDSSQPVLTIEHELKNTGAETIDTQVYNHDFFMLDGARTGPGVIVRFPFMPKTDRPLENGAHLEGNEIVYSRELEAGQSAFAAITGYNDRPSDFDFVVKDTNTGVGVEESGSLPLSHVVFWSVPTTICPEAYVHIQVTPGQTVRWTIRYRFYAK